MKPTEQQMKSTADKCNNGAHKYICINCANKYKTRTTTVDTELQAGTCAICHTFGPVGYSKALMGLSIKH